MHLSPTSQPAVNWLEILESHLARKRQGVLVFSENHILQYVSEYARELLEFEENQVGFISLEEVFPQFTNHFDSGEKHFNGILVYTTGSGRQKKIRYTYETENLDRRGLTASVIWLETTDSPERTAIAEKRLNPGVAGLLDQLNLGYLEINEDGFIRDYNSTFKTLLDLPGEWISRNIFTYPPMHQYGIAPYLVQKLKSGGGPERKVFNYGYAGISRHIRLHWSAVTGGEDGGAVFVVNVEKDHQSLHSRANLQKAFIEQLLEFMRRFETQFNRDEYFSLLQEYWGGIVFQAAEWAVLHVNDVARRVKVYRDSAGIGQKSFSIDDDVSEFLLAGPGENKQMPAAISNILFARTEDFPCIQFELDENDHEKFVFLFALRQTDLLSAMAGENYEYVVELLNKFYQKVKLNQQLLQEVSNLTRRSEALAQKNREKKELFEVFRESNNTLYERLHHYEKKIKELKRNQEQNVEQRQQTFVDNFVQGFRNSLESVSALALSGESEQDRLAVLRHDFLTMEQPGPSTLQLIDLNKLLEAVVLKLHRRYRILNRVRFNMDRVPEVLSHPDKISAAFSQVIRAMLLNLAVRQQDLTISAEHVAKAVTIRLTIPGTLYNQEESSRLFDPFYRTPGDPDEEMIGLFRARYLLAMCNGEIYFDQAKGPVSRFVIRIPE